MKELRDIPFTWERGTCYNYGWLDGVACGFILGVSVGAGIATIIVSFFEMCF